MTCLIILHRIRKCFTWKLNNNTKKRATYMEIRELEIRIFKRPTPAHFKLLLTADPSKKIVAAYLERSTCFEARRGHELIGVFILLATRPETVELVNIAVAARFQGQGVGTHLVKAALQWAQHKGYQVVEIGTGTTSFQQLALYQKCGFRVVGVDPDFFTRNYQEPIIENKLRLRDMLRLRKYLA